MQYNRYQDRNEYESDRGGRNDPQWEQRQGGWNSPERETGWGQSRQEGSTGYRGGPFGQSSFGQSRYSQEDRNGGYGQQGQQGQQRYGSHAQDDYRREQYGVEGAREPWYGGWGSRRDEYGAGGPQSQGYERGRYGREQSDYSQQRYGSGAAGWSGYERGGYGGGQQRREYGYEGGGYGGGQPRREYGYEGGSQGGNTGYSGAGYGQSPIGEYTQFGNRANRNPDRRGPKGYSRSDDRIKDEVCECFMRADSLDPGEIEVEVKAGEVTLSGQVQDREDKFNAERIAHSVLGVKDVNNHIRCASRSSEQNRDRSSSSQSGNESSRSSSSSSLGETKQKSALNVVGATR